MKTLQRVAALVLCIAVLTMPALPYSVLTHEQVIDLSWQDHIQPLLLKRFPTATPEDLRRAHAFAYGGSLVQDMGYYPFGKKYFSDLLHYVRSGDFVTALLDESSDLNEYAFALGALAHYSSDNMGHPTINQIVAIEFPKLKAKYGNEVTYADDPKAHIQTEFGFDMVQVAKNRYTSDRYHDFIGFEVSRPVLERAFFKTYGVKLEEVLGDPDLAIGSFRRAVSKFVPQMTRVALLNRRADLVREIPNFDQKKFLYRISRSNYEKEWGKGYRKPGFGSRVLAFLLRKIPKIGPARALAFKVPTAKTEDLYIKSVDRTTDEYNARLRDVGQSELHLRDIDCDTGRPTSASEYSLADKAFSHLLDDLSKNNFATLTPDLRANILDFYSRPPSPPRKKKEREEWARTQKEIEQLKNAPTAEPGPLTPVKP